MHPARLVIRHTSTPSGGGLNSLRAVPFKKCVWGGGGGGVGTEGFFEGGGGGAEF